MQHLWIIVQAFPIGNIEIHRKSELTMLREEYSKTSSRSKLGVIPISIGSKFQSEARHTALVGFNPNLTNSTCSIGRLWVGGFRVWAELG